MEANSKLAQVSPKMPTMTTPVAMKSSQNLHRGARSGGRTMPLAQSCLSSQSSEAITVHSPKMPRTTTSDAAMAMCSQWGEAFSATFSELSRAEMELSKADMQASVADEALSRSEGIAARYCMIAIIGILCFLAGLIVFLAIREKRWGL
jgi:hypothetical protein